MANLKPFFLKYQVSSLLYTNFIFIELIASYSLIIVVQFCLYLWNINITKKSLDERNFQWNIMYCCIVLVLLKTNREVDKTSKLFIQMTRKLHFIHNCCQYRMFTNVLLNLNYLQLLCLYGISIHCTNLLDAKKLMSKSINTSLHNLMINGNKNE